jgi:hypothetical protein
MCAMLDRGDEREVRDFTRPAVGACPAKNAPGDERFLLAPGQR